MGTNKQGQPPQNTASQMASCSKVVRVSTVWADNLESNREAYLGEGARPTRTNAQAVIGAKASASLTSFRRCRIRRRIVDTYFRKEAHFNLA